MTLFYETISYSSCGQLRRAVLVWKDAIAYKVLCSQTTVISCNNVMPLGSTELCASRPPVSRSLEHDRQFSPRSGRSEHVGYAWFSMGVHNRKYLDPTTSAAYSSRRNILPRAITFPCSLTLQAECLTLAISSRSTVASVSSCRGLSGQSRFGNSSRFTSPDQKNAPLRR